jgi:hypothetical protein
LNWTYLFTGLIGAATGSAIVLTFEMHRHRAYHVDTVLQLFSFWLGAVGLFGALALISWQNYHGTAFLVPHDHTLRLWGTALVAMLPAGVVGVCFALSLRGKRKDKKRAGRRRPPHREDNQPQAVHDDWFDETSPSPA